MDVAACIKSVVEGQCLLRALAVFQLVTSLWPRQALVPDGCCYDYIVVGSGSAGSVIANRLTEDPTVNVLLIEAGGDPPFASTIPGLLLFLPHSSHEWNFTNGYDKYQEMYQDNRSLPATLGKMLGGCSSLNYMFYVRGNPEDFNTWAELAGDSIWNYTNILPYFKKSEKLVDPEILNSDYKQYHGTTGNVQVAREPNPINKKYLEMFKELGHNLLLDTNGYYNLGYNEPSFIISPNGERQGTAFCFLRPIKQRPNLHVLKNTQVTKILFDNQKNAIGVQALREDGTKMTFKAKKEIIISAGAINSPKLLMLSGIGPKKHLKSMGIDVISDLPVGQNLQDHVASFLIHQFGKSNDPPEAPDMRKFLLPAMTGYVSLNKSKLCPDYQAFPFALPNDSPAPMQMPAIGFGLAPEICQAMYDATKGRETLFSAVTLLHPKSRGQVCLRSTDPKDPPVINLGHYTDESDLETMINSLEDFDRLRCSTLFKSVGGSHVDHKMPMCAGLKYGTREYWRCHALSGRVGLYHYVGTCAMGSVVDSRLRVRGVKRLRVADGSAAPSQVSGNTNAAIMMLGERAADIIKEDNRCRS